MKKTGLLLVIALFAFAIKSNAQTKLLLTYQNNSEQTYAFSESDRLYFQDNMLVLEIENKTTTVPLSTIRKISFPTVDDTYPIIDESNSIQSNSEENVFIYPNPATDYVYIVNANSESMNINIFSLNGKLLQSTQTADTKISIEHLPAGFYLLKVNEKTFKLTKQ